MDIRHQASLVDYELAPEEEQNYIFPTQEQWVGWLKACFKTIHVQSRWDSVIPGALGEKQIKMKR